MIISLVFHGETLRTPRQFQLIVENIMIFDEIQFWNKYPYGAAWEKIFTFLKEIDAQTEEKEYPIQGKDLFARVMSYDTRPVEEAKLEAHRIYADIQIMLAGSEIMEWFPASSAIVTTPYNEEKDVLFFQHIPNAPCRILARPGFFALFMPQDAHMPQLMAGNAPERIKKVVVKVRCDLLGL